jgi:PTH1 family peptidyl-tRNA hydrolase
LAHVVVGLGNPGPEYRDTRHNIGQRVVDALASQLKKAFRPEAGAHVARATWRGDTLYLVKPQSFMNVSGAAVRRVLQTVGASADELVLVYDDIDMELGKVRTRLKGSAGGHNGVKSVIEAVGTDAIRRVKIGIGRPVHKAQVPDHVLAAFDPEEDDVVAAAVATAAERVLALLR